MGLFDKIKEPVFLKESSTVQTQIKQLEELYERAPEKVKGKITQEIKMLSAGVVGEETIAYELRNSHMPMMILHDLYLKEGEFSSQIDYLIITRKRNFVIECKNLLGNIEINSNGDFVRTIDLGSGRFKKEGIYSPITQNERHLELIKRLRGATRTNILSKMMFERSFYENYRSVVVLANPKTVLNAKYAKKEIKSQVIRADQLIAYLKKINMECDASPVPEQRMEQLAQFFLELHRDNPVDYTEKYRKLLEETEQEQAVSVQPFKEKAGSALQEKPEGTQQEQQAFVTKDSVFCPKCGAPMVRRVASRGSNTGKEFFGCSQFPKCRGVINIDSNA